MDLQQLSELQQMDFPKPVVLVTVDDLEDKSDRTLVYGYDTERFTHHTYIKNGEIFTVLYKPDTPISIKEMKSNDDFSPNKRLYPERSDYEFCKLLKKLGVHVSFTTYSEDSLEWPSSLENKPYFGKTL